GLADLGLTSVLQGVDIHTVSRFSDGDLSRLEGWGVERISIGVESGTDRVRRRLLHKWGSVDVVREQFRRLRDRRFLVLCTFIVGFPGETAEEIRRTVELALWTLRAGSNFRIPQIYNYVPYPGTELASSLEARGVELPRTLDGWAGHDWDRSVLDEHGQSRDELERLAFLSKFLDRKDLDYGFGGIALRLAYRAYRPVARLRLATGITSPLPERGLYDGVRRLRAAGRGGAA
ncbi:MAG TPA: radical SAM protein, partial [Anaeromyxobacter sp.]|nr:radical SAM protein [Anaeromyxobacter sp.]